MVVDLLSEGSVGLASGAAVGGDGLSPNQAANGTNTDVKIFEEGEEAETPGPAPSGQDSRSSCPPPTG